jgi:hypothetical protein
LKFKADVLVEFRKDRTLVEKARTRLNVMWFVEKPDELKMRILERWLWIILLTVIVLGIFKSGN